MLKKKMIESKHWRADIDDICQKVLTEVFGEGHVFGLDEFNTLCTVIEKTLACVSENSDEDKINHIYDLDYVRTSGFLMSQSAVREMINNG